jgi:hypothetical protein
VGSGKWEVGLAKREPELPDVPDAQPSGTSEASPVGRKVEVVTAGEGWKRVMVRWRTRQQPTAPPSPGALR